MFLDIACLAALGGDPAGYLSLLENKMHPSLNRFAMFFIRLGRPLGQWRGGFRLVFQDRVQGWKKKWVVSAAVAACFSLTLFFFAPLSVYLHNAAEFDVSLINFARAFFIKTVIAFLVTSAVCLLFELFFLFDRVSVIVCALSFLLWLEGGVLPYPYGPLDGREIHWAHYIVGQRIEAAIWIVVLACAVLTAHLIRAFIPKICIGLILIQTIAVAATFKQAIPTIWPQTNMRLGFDRSFERVFSSRQNAILIVLDAFRSDLFQEVIKDDPAYLSILDGFTYFRNAVSGYPATYCSIPLILTGLYYDNSEPFSLFARRVYIQHSLPRILQDYGFRTDIYPDYYPGWRYLRIPGIASNLVAFPRGRDLGGVNKILDVVFLRYGPTPVKKYIYYRYSQNQGTVSSRRNRILKTGSRYHAPSLISQSVFKFIDVPGLHPPFISGDGASALSYLVSWPEYIRRAKELLANIGQLINTLKALAIYDNTVIVIVGDHGWQDFDIRFPDDIAVKFAAPPADSDIPALIVERHIPLMLVKPPNTSGSLRLSDAPVSLGDIPATICSCLGIRGVFEGVSVFDISESAQRQRRCFYYNEGKRDKISEYLPPMEEFIVDGFSWMSSSWRKTGRLYLEPIKGKR